MCFFRKLYFIHEVDNFILPVTTRFQNHESLDIDGQTTNAPLAECAPLQQPLSGVQSVRDNTKFPHAVQVPRGNRKTPPVVSGMDSPCGMQYAHTTPEAVVMDESKSVDAAQLSRGDTKTPPEMAVVDSPGPTQYTHVPAVPCAPADNPETLLSDTLHAYNTPLVHGTKIDNNSDTSIRHDVFVDSNSVASDNKCVTDLPVISSVDYETDA